MGYPAQRIVKRSVLLVALPVLLVTSSCSMSILEPVKRGAATMVGSVRQTAETLTAPFSGAARDLTKPLNGATGGSLKPVADEAKAMLEPVAGTAEKIAGPLKKMHRDIAAATADAIENPYSSGDHVALARSRARQELMASRVRPSTTVTGKRYLTLADCRRLALMNNREIRLSRWDERTRDAADEINKIAILPHLIFSGEAKEGHVQRFTYSDVFGAQGLPASSVQGFGVNQYSSGRERNQWRYQLEAQWSPNEALQAYYRARNGENDKLLAHYQRVGKIQEVWGIIDASYFRLLALQELLPLSERLVKLRSYVSSRFLEQTRDNLASVDQFNEAKQQEVRARLLHEQFKNGMEEQRNLLASAMAVSPAQGVDGGFVLAGNLKPPPTSAERRESVLHQLELIAVQNRPELYRATLDRLKADNDVKRVFINYFPQLIGYWRHSHDDDKYMRDADSKEVGVNIRYDLRDILRTLEESQAARTKREGTDRAIDAAVASIVRDARQGAIKHYDAMTRVGENEKSLQSSRAVLALAQNKYSLGDLDRIQVEKARADVLEKRIELLRAVGEANATLAELNRALAINYREPPPEG